MCVGKCVLCVECVLGSVCCEGNVFGMCVGELCVKCVWASVACEENVCG